MTFRLYSDRTREYFFNKPIHELFYDWADERNPMQYIGHEKGYWDDTRKRGQDKHGCRIVY